MKILFLWKKHYIFHTSLNKLLCHGTQGEIGVICFNRVGYTG